MRGKSYRNSVWSSERSDFRRNHARQTHRLLAPPWRNTLHSASQNQLSRQLVGNEIARGEAHHFSMRGGKLAKERGTWSLRGLRSVCGPNIRPPDTFYDGQIVTHVSAADPYCPEMRKVAIEACRSAGIVVHERGTVVVVQGPRFWTKSESKWFSSQGWEVIR